MKQNSGVSATSMMFPARVCLSFSWPSELNQKCPPQRGKRAEPSLPQNPPIEGAAKADVLGDEMKGAIAGDILGSFRENVRMKKKNFSLLSRFVNKESTDSGAGPRTPNGTA